MLNRCVPCSPISRRSAASTANEGEPDVQRKPPSRPSYSSLQPGKVGVICQLPALDRESALQAVSTGGRSQCSQSSFFVHSSSPLLSLVPASPFLDESMG